MAEWFRALVLSSGGPGFNPPPLSGFVLGRVQILGHAVYIESWYASCQCGFLTMLCFI